MFKEHFIITLSIFSVCYAGDNNYDYQPKNTNQVWGAPCQAEKISEELSNLKITMLKANEDILTHLEAMKSVLEKKLNILENNSINLEKKLEGSVENLKDYIDNKINHLYQKLEAQEKTLSSKSDVTTINDKLNSLNKYQAELTMNVNCSSNEPENKTLVQFSEIMKKIDGVEQQVSKSKINTKNTTCDIMHQYFIEFSNNLANNITEIKNNVPNMADINRKLDSLNTKTQNYLNEQISSKLNKIEKNILNVQENISVCSNNSNDKPTQNIEEKHEIQKIIPDMQQIITTGLQNLEKIDNAILAKLNKLPENWRCKEQMVAGYGYKQFYRLYNSTFNYVTYRNSSNGTLYFEMHLAIKADADAHILLSSAPSKEDKVVIHEIVIGSSSNTYSVIRNKKLGVPEVSPLTPNILSTTKFTEFYLKIDNDYLEVRKGNEVILSQSNDARLKEVQYFSFSSYGDRTGTIYYDCCC